MSRWRAISWLLLAGLSIGAAVAVPFAKGPLEKIDLAQKQIVIRDATTGLCLMALIPPELLTQLRGLAEAVKALHGEVVDLRTAIADLTTALQERS